MFEQREGWMAPPPPIDGTNGVQHRATACYAWRAFFLPFEPVAPHQKWLSSPPREGASLWIIGSATSSPLGDSSLHR